MSDYPVNVYLSLLKFHSHLKHQGEQIVSELNNATISSVVNRLNSDLSKVGTKVIILDILLEKAETERSVNYSSALLQYQHLPDVLTLTPEDIQLVNPIIQQEEERGLQRHSRLTRSPPQDTGKVKQPFIASTPSKDSGLPTSFGYDISNITDQRTTLHPTIVPETIQEISEASDFTGPSVYYPTLTPEIVTTSAPTPLPKPTIAPSRFQYPVSSTSSNPIAAGQD